MGSMPWEDYAPASHGSGPWEDYAHVANQPKMGVAEDVAKSAGSGLAKGAVGLLTTPFDLPKMAEYGASYAAAKAAERLGLLPNGKTANDFVKSAQDTFGGQDYAAPSIIGRMGLHEPETTAGKYAGSVGEMAPAIFSGGGSILGKGAQTVGAGVGSEAAGEAAKGTPYETAARVAGGIAGGLAPRGVSGAVTPFPISDKRSALVDVLNKENIPMTAGQKTGNRGLQYLESTTSDMPLGGGRARQIEEEQANAFSEAASKRAGIKGNTSPENMADRYDQFGKQFSDLGSRNTLNMDPKFGTDIGKTIDKYHKLVPEGQRISGVQNYVDAILEKAKTAKQIPGDVYNSWRSDLAELARGTDNARDKDAILGIINSLDSAMERSIVSAGNMADAEAFRQVRREYANYKILEGAAGKSAEDTITPKQLRTAVSSGPNKGRYVRGQADLGELARAGVRVLSPMPNSGTQGRLTAQGILAAPGAALGAIAGGAPGAAAGTVLAPLLPGLVGRGLLSKPVQAYLGNQVLKERLAPNKASSLGLLMLNSPELRDQFIR